MSHNMSRIVSYCPHSCQKEISLKQLQTTSTQGSHPSILDFFIYHAFHTASLGICAKAIPASEPASPQSGGSQGKLLKTR